MKKSVQAIIVGGGIGGLAAAVALRQAGVEASVYERAAELGEVGAGLAIWRNAVHALGRLGLAEVVESHATPDLGGGIRTSRGELLADLGRTNRRDGGPALSIIIHRARLLEILRDALGAEHVRLGAQLIEFSQAAGGVVARFADGRAASADLIVGADGINSAVRAQLFGPARPRYAGYSAWRAVTSFDASRARAAAGETWGCGARFGIAPMRGDQVYWFASINRREGAIVPSGQRKRFLLERLRGWHAPIAALIEATDEADILQHDIYDRPPLHRWSAGRATLLGDAAHPMTPNLGQGACQAIEDAVALADALRAYDDVADALCAYQERRSGRTGAIVRQSRRVGQVAQWGLRPACAARDRLAKLLLPLAMERQIARLVDYRV